MKQTKISNSICKILPPMNFGQLSTAIRAFLPFSGYEISNLDTPCEPQSKFSRAFLKSALPIYFRYFLAFKSARCPRRCVTVIFAQQKTFLVKTLSFLQRPQQSACLITLRNKTTWFLHKFICSSILITAAFKRTSRI